jgi:hypothetical protein
LEAKVKDSDMVKDRYKDKYTYRDKAMDMEDGKQEPW